MAITFEEAHAIASGKLVELEEANGFDAVIEDAATIETPSAWIFFYENPAYLASGDAKQQLFGNPPIVVALTGEVLVTGTEWPVVLYLQPFLGRGGTVRNRVR